MRRMHLAEADAQLNCFPHCPAPAASAACGLPLSTTLAA